MAARRFFSAGAAEELITSCLRLAMIYRCDPACFLSRSPEYLAVVNRHTPDVLEEMIEAKLYGG
ncbi:hypothetical protein [Methylobacterium brachiatum]|uniref:hypothetical protein n=1 Tax=Methylobacterium brachiatum TaxID=269660 RepID=UPI0008F2C059|nr:hypothetical protein [Methylobacterium brachiatum]SFJ67875.1 hypothetical protein SAMN02799642_05143 [Methylobacterium brachiatum]